MLEIRRGVKIPFKLNLKTATLSRLPLKLVKAQRRFASAVVFMSTCQRGKLSQSEAAHAPKS